MKVEGIMKHSISSMVKSSTKLNVTTVHWPQTHIKPNKINKAGLHLSLKCSDLKPIKDFFSTYKLGACQETNTFIWTLSILSRRVVKYSTRILPEVCLRLPKNLVSVELAKEHFGQILAMLYVFLTRYVWLDIQHLYLSCWQMLPNLNTGQMDAQIWGDQIMTMWNRIINLFHCKMVDQISYV